MAIMEPVLKPGALHHQISQDAIQERMFTQEKLVASDSFQNTTTIRLPSSRWMSLLIYVALARVLSMGALSCRVRPGAECCPV